jgi:hypothetical protein
MIFGIYLAHRLFSRNSKKTTTPSSGNTAQHWQPSTLPLANIKNHRNGRLQQCHTQYPPPVGYAYPKPSYPDTMYPPHAHSTQHLHCHNFPLGYFIALVIKKNQRHSKWCNTIHFFLLSNRFILRFKKFFSIVHASQPHSADFSWRHEGVWGNRFPHETAKKPLPTQKANAARCV